MSADVVQARYDELESVAQRFGALAEATAELDRRTAQSFQSLVQGGWQGRGSAAFNAEMSSELFPALRRFQAALDEAQRVTLEVSGIMQEAEEEASSRFNGAGGAAPASAGIDRSDAAKLSDGLRITGMQPVANGELFLTGSGDGRAIHPSDAKQGNIGDCFVVTSLAAVAEQQPDLIKNAIRDNGDGTYTVTFYKKSGGIFGIGESVKPVQITVNSDLPTGQSITGGVASPASPHILANDVDGGKQEIWAQVMEKAYAQWQGSGNAQRGYGTLNEGGHTSDVLFALTGSESSWGDPHKYSLSKLAEMERNGQAITLSSLSSGDGGKKQLYKDGTLVTGHAYYVTAVDEKSGMVTIQNPWGWDEHKVTVPYDQLDDHFRGMTVNSLKK